MASGVTGTPDLSTALRLRFFKQQQSQVEHLMTKDERQALRYKHRDNGIDGRCETCHYDTPIEGLFDISVCTAPPYPCDVIKVLDATEMWYKS